MAKTKWYDAGRTSDLKKRSLHQIDIGGLKIALSYRKGAFAAVSGECNHVKGPLGKGRMKGDYIVCLWHGSAVPLPALRRRAGFLEPTAEIPVEVTFHQL